MSRRAVLATAAALVLSGSAVPALAQGAAATVSGAEPTYVCVITKTQPREGVCVWVPVSPPPAAADAADAAAR